MGERRLKPTRRSWQPTPAPHDDATWHAMLVLTALGGVLALLAHFL